MSSIHYLHRRDEIAIVGWALRFPGAKSTTELWSLLLEGRCSVTRVPEGRFSLERFGHPRGREPGKSYTWAAGVLDDIWGFDPSVFGISPREAEQMDPQQRMLLQLTWEALEDAGIRPSSIAGTDVGVFVGASQTDYGHAYFTDYAIADAQFATGTALAVLANRISYIFDLRGPSVTIDTACSSSLVALHQAVEALQSGRIDTAIVAGINLIASPASFIAFSQASMLSPTGLCQAFSAKADGFVRGEGGAVVVLRKVATAQASKNPMHGLVLATDVNSDGRTNGISLPNMEAQEALLQRIYSRSAIDVDRLAFVEAHGTGTAAGDPIEANALGRGIGRARSNPLPIGSIKTNIGHLEPASGFAGLLKAVMALNHGILPPSLHFEEPSPHIEFDSLNLKVCDQSLLLPNASQSFAGVNSFGFGGTNAHAIIAAGRKPQPVENAHNGSQAGFFAISAESRGALAQLAQNYAERVEHLSDQDAATLASAVVYRRDHLTHRAVVSTTRSQDVVKALNAFIAGEENPNLTSGEAVGTDNAVAFVYSGNGSQWVGMGITAYNNNPHFRAHFDQVDGYFKQIAGWSLKDTLFSDTLTDRLPLTSIGQPLLFAIQSAATAALRARGLHPAAVIGHSVGEVAAAEAANALDLRTAIKVIYYRSTHQELVRGAGRMAAVLAPADAVTQLLQEIGQPVEIAAVNSPRAVTIVGPADALAAFKAAARARSIVMVDLDLDYPFHSTLMAPVEKGLIADLKNIQPRDADVPFVSTVTGACVPGSRLTGQYWWRNVREPVQFAGAVREAAKLGARYFVEIGPRPTLLKHVGDSLTGEVGSFGTLSVLDRTDDRDVDPFDKAFAKALVGGAQIDLGTAFGGDPGPEIKLPFYPWQQKQFRYTATPEAIGVELERHPFAGARVSADTLEWHAHIDTSLYPELADHVVGEQTIFPGTAFFEVALAVAQQWMRTENVIITNFEIFKPLDLTNGETREVMTRVSPGSNTIEIFSRPRLSNAAWLLHSRGKMHHGTATEATPGPALGPVVQRLETDAVYGIADGSGLHYGPAFRLVDEAVMHENGLISVQLKRQNAPTPFLIDPMRLDACSHGLFTVFPELRVEERGVTYIPVRMEETTLYRSRITPERAVIEIISKSERSVIANYYIYGAGDEISAVFRRVQCQAVPVKRMRSIGSVAVIERVQLIDGMISADTGVPVIARDVVAAARDRGLLSTEGSGPADGVLLVEGWATAAAYEIASGLADGTTVDVDMLVANGKVAESLRPWLVNLLLNLEAANLATQESGSWSLVPDHSLPSSASVVKALAAEHRSRAAELLLAGAVTGFVEDIAAKGAVSQATDSIFPKAAFDFYDGTNIATSEATDALSGLILGIDRIWPEDRAIRVLQIGAGPLAQALDTLRDNVQLTVFEPDRRRYEHAELGLTGNHKFPVLNMEHVAKLETYDLIVSVDGLNRLPPELGLVELKGLLAPRGLLIAIEPQPSLFKDIVFGLDSRWFKPGVADLPVGPLQSAEQWATALAHAGFAQTEANLIACGSDFASLIVAESAATQVVAQEVPIDAQPVAAQSALVVVPGGQSPLAAKLAEPADVSQIVASLATLADVPAVVPSAVIFVPVAEEDPVDAVKALTQRCMDLKRLAEKIGGPATLWLIFSGALGTGSSPVRPVETGAWAFSRTLANEFPKLDVRRIDLAPGLDPDVAAERIKSIVLSGTAETELQIDGNTTRAVRVQSLNRTLDHLPVPPAAAANLQRRSSLGRRLAWQPAERRRPADNEIEIAVEATGVNFRDLMWMLSLLPDDMLEDGYTGPNLGLECAGRIVRVGSAVKTLKVGDRVAAFAGLAFSTHVTIAAAQAVKLPNGISSEDAATIPVAFVTAYYSLITLANLKRGEWVLVHGGAGGVGMAATQIAQARGAKVIATAGSKAKRDLLKALGVTYILDSRSTNFVNDVREITGAGVDVVLNSLAGEAMERSIDCLRAFGRFVELGKRDYVTDTHIGLRPFRKNLTYFGVDLDQLMVGRKSVGEKAYADVMKLFDKGTYRPLPYSVFKATDVLEAFHLMQHSGHIGKIVVRPPTPGSVRAANKALSISAQGTHVITGAFGGFGLETAKWLVEHGARHLVLIGRKGAATEEAKAAVESFTRRGVKVLADPCDVTDARALQKLFEKIHATMPPVVGVMHAAMVLGDAIITNLDAEQFHTVLRPKVDGADNLDMLTRGMALDYFLLFSSVTTLIGNPGQGNYVAANAYMEGLARRRRQEGLPALAIGWGPITDVGVVARNARLQSNLQKLTGVTGMRAREALDLMAQALEQPAAQAELAVLTISPNNSSFSSERLPVLRSPTYASFILNSAGSESDVGRVDLRALLKSEGIEAVRHKVTGTIVSQLARVLHAREEDISRTRPLGEIGLDSLMALELVLNLEECFGMRIALSGSAGVLTISGVAEEIIAHLNADHPREDAASAALAEQHAETVDPGQFEALKTMVGEETQKVKRLLN